MFKGKEEAIKKGLQELEKSIYSRFKEIASKIPVQKSNLINNFQKLTANIDKRGEDIHIEIDTISNKTKSEIGELELRHLNVLQKQEGEIAHTFQKSNRALLNYGNYLTPKMYALFLIIYQGILNSEN